MSQRNIRRDYAQSGPQRSLARRGHEAITQGLSSLSRGIANMGNSFAQIAQRERQVEQQEESHRRKLDLQGYEGQVNRDLLYLEAEAEKEATNNPSRHMRAKYDEMRSTFFEEQRKKVSEDDPLFQDKMAALDTREDMVRAKLDILGGKVEDEAIAIEWQTSMSEFFNETNDHLSRMDFSRKDAWEQRRLLSEKLIMPVESYIEDNQENRPRQDFIRERAKEIAENVLTQHAVTISDEVEDHVFLELNSIDPQTNWAPLQQKVRTLRARIRQDQHQEFVSKVVGELKSRMGSGEDPHFNWQLNLEDMGSTVREYLGEVGSHLPPDAIKSIEDEMKRVMAQREKEIKANPRNAITYINRHPEVRNAYQGVIQAGQAFRAAQKVAHEGTPEEQEEAEELLESRKSNLVQAKVKHRSIRDRMAKEHGVNVRDRFLVDPQEMESILETFRSGSPSEALDAVLGLRDAYDKSYLHNMAEAMTDRWKDRVPTGVAVTVALAASNPNNPLLDDIAEMALEDFSPQSAKSDYNSVFGNTSWGRDAASKMERAMHNSPYFRHWASRNLDMTNWMKGFVYRSAVEGANDKERSPSDTMWDTFNGLTKNFDALVEVGGQTHLVGLPQFASKFSQFFGLEDGWSDADQYGSDLSNGLNVLTQWDELMMPGVSGKLDNMAELLAVEFDFLTGSGFFGASMETGVELPEGFGTAPGYQLARKLLGNVSQKINPRARIAALKNGQIIPFETIALPPTDPNVRSGGDWVRELIPDADMPHKEKVFRLIDSGALTVKFATDATGQERGYLHWRSGDFTMGRRGGTIGATTGSNDMMPVYFQGYDQVDPEFQSEFQVSIPAEELAALGRMVRDAQAEQRRDVLDFLSPKGPTESRMDEIEQERETSPNSRIGNLLHDEVGNRIRSRMNE